MAPVFSQCKKISYSEIRISPIYRFTPRLIFTHYRQKAAIRRELRGREVKTKPVQPHGAAGTHGILKHYRETQKEEIHP